MKRFFVLLICILVMLAGCTTAPKKENLLPSQFTAVANVNFDETDYCVNLTRYADSNWVVEFTAPETVCGLIFTTENGETDISFKGLHFTFDTQKFPVGSVVKILCGSYDRLVPIEHEMVEGDKSDFVTGQVDDMSYTLSTDKNGIPIKLELGDSGMCIEFESFECAEATE